MKSDVIRHARVDAWHVSRSLGVLGPSNNCDTLWTAQVAQSREETTVRVLQCQIRWIPCACACLLAVLRETRVSYAATVAPRNPRAGVGLLRAGSHITQTETEPLSGGMGCAGSTAASPGDMAVDAEPPAPTPRTESLGLMRANPAFNLQSFTTSGSRARCVSVYVARAHGLGTAAKADVFVDARSSSGVGADERAGAAVPAVAGSAVFHDWFHFVVPRPADDGEWPPVQLSVESIAGSAGSACVGRATVEVQDGDKGDKPVPRWVRLEGGSDSATVLVLVVARDYARIRALVHGATGLSDLCLQRYKAALAAGATGPRPRGYVAMVHGVSGAQTESVSLDAPSGDAKDAWRMEPPDTLDVWVASSLYEAEPIPLYVEAHIDIEQPASERSEGASGGAGSSANPVYAEDKAFRSGAALDALGVGGFVSTVVARAKLDAREFIGSTEPLNRTVALNDVESDAEVGSVTFEASLHKLDRRRTQTSERRRRGTAASFKLELPRVLLRAAALAQGAVNDVERTLAASNEVIEQPEWVYPPAKELPMAIQRLHDFMNQPPNRTCADCGGPKPTWASTNLGVFLCAACCGVHRAMGVHISFVQSCYYDWDRWSDDKVGVMLSKGNAAMAVAKRDIVEELRPINPSSPRFVREHHIRRKYGAPDADPVVDETTTEVTEPAAKGVLYIVVKSAANIENSDLIGKSDPYCVVKLGSGANSTKRTKVISNSLDPHWNARLGGLYWDGESLLRVEVFDKDFLRDDSLGKATISLEGIPDLLEQVVTVPLQGVKSGIITLELTYQDVR